MKKPVIFVVDDSHVTRETLKHVFTTLGCEVLGAASGEEALEKLEKGTQVDVIILDFKLPGMSGPDLYQKLLLDKAKRWKDIPVVPFSSQFKEDHSKNPEYVKKWLTAAFVAKKVKGEEVADVVPKTNGRENAVTFPHKLAIDVAEGLKKRGIELSSDYEQLLKAIGEIQTL